MLNTYTIGRIGKDCQVISGKHGSFMALDMDVDDYQKGESTTTWVRVKSSKENHIKLSEYLTKGRLILVHGTLSSSIWEDKNGNSHVQLSIVADTINFIHTGKKGTEANAASEADGNTEAHVQMSPESPPQERKKICLSKNTQNVPLTEAPIRALQFCDGQEHPHPDEIPCHRKRHVVERDCERSHA